MYCVPKLRSDSEPTFPIKLIYFIVLAIKFFEKAKQTGTSSHKATPIYSLIRGCFSWTVYNGTSFVA